MYGWRLENRGGSEGFQAPAAHALARREHARRIRPDRDLGGALRDPGSALPGPGGPCPAQATPRPAQAAPCDHPAATAFADTAAEYSEYGAHAAPGRRSG